MSQETDLSFHLHAELLPNIRQVTLYISLPTDEASESESRKLQPEVALSQSRRAVTVSLPEPFQDVTETIKLPARVGEASRHVLKSGRAGDDKKELSFRMQIDSGETPFMSRDDVTVTDDFVPLTAADMSPSTRLRCRGCENVILDCPGLNVGKDQNDAPAPARTGWTWKDLPSGNWAEMMDFWHCHKPDTHEDDKDPSAEAQNDLVKGYGAANRVVAISGTVLVDVPGFLVTEGDCKGLKKIQDESHNTSSDTRRVNIVCETCNALIGMEDPAADGWRLFKASLSAQPQSDQREGKEASWIAHSPETVVAAQLLELIERESARRFAVHYGRNNGLLLWVFNPDLRYSRSSNEHSTTAQRAMKVFFQETSNIDAMITPDQGKASPLSLEELELPYHIFNAVSNALVRSSEMLPQSARQFREWRVGLLNRFERRRG